MNRTKSSFLDLDIDLDSSIKKNYLNLDLESNIKKDFLDINLDSTLKKSFLNFDFDSTVIRGFLDIDLDSNIKKSFLDIGLNSSMEKNFLKFEFDSKITEIINYSALENDSEYLIEQQYSAENITNRNRENYLNKYVLPNFISLLREEDFEFGYITRSEEVLRDQFQINALATRNWLNEIFLKYFNDEQILIGVLRIIGRFSEQMIFPQGQTIALASLNHENDEIKELGIRAFEKWVSYDSINILSKIKTETHWLQEYIDQVIRDLKEELCHC